MGVREPYPLKGLSYEESCNLFKKLAIDEERDPPSPLIHILEKLYIGAKECSLQWKVLPVSSALQLKKRLGTNIRKRFGES